jgi:2-methylaconitate cis-trans-isomerase PrpF
MRGGTSKGVFFALDDLPDCAGAGQAARCAAAAGDRHRRILTASRPTAWAGRRRAPASGDLSRRAVPGHDVDYLYGQVPIEGDFVDWSGNCGNLSSAVGPFAIANGLVDADRVPRTGIATVRIWQANIGKTIVAHVPMTEGRCRKPATSNWTA